MKNGKKRLFILLLCIWLSGKTVLAAELLVPGGQVVGLELADGTVTVAAFDDQLGQAARSSGLQIGDRITAINGKTVRSASDIQKYLRESDGQAELSLLRDGNAKKITVKPEITPDGPRLGIYLRQGVTGVGTVTWYDPETGRFGALGHGVNSGNGSLLVMEKGAVFAADVLAVKQGKIGTPGQLMSTVTGSGSIGFLQKNTVQGVFGQAKLSGLGEKLPVGTKEAVHAGAAVIRSTVKDHQVQEYSVEILKVYPNSGAGGRNMLLKVTDPELLTATGGIVQGMSGSPIIQDGKLVGAVTHVLVNDPTTGYGIFIENMLDAAG